METIEIIGIVIGAVGAVLAGIWHISRQIFGVVRRLDEHTHRFDLVDQRFDRLESDVRQLGEKFVQLDGKVTHLEIRFDRMDSKVTHLETRFDRMDSKFDNLPCVSHGDMLSRISFFLLQKFPGPVTLLALRGSPRHLSDLGLKIYAEMDGESFLERNKDALFSYISSHSPLCAFDVESLCLPACESLISTSAFTPLKDYLYNSSMIDCPGGLRHELTLPDICYTLSFPLRDKYLSEVGITSSSS
jgi:hypothetical protein